MNKSRKSAAEKQAAGTYRPDRDAAVAGFTAVEDGSALKPPAEVAADPDALAFWESVTDALAAAGTLAISDAMTLMQLCLIHSQWLKATATVMREGQTYAAQGESGATLVKRHPAVQIALELGKERRMLLAACGLLPDSRHRVKPLAKPEPEDSEVTKWMNTRANVVQFEAQGDK